MNWQCEGRATFGLNKQGNERTEKDVRRGERERRRGWGRNSKLQVRGLGSEWLMWGKRLLEKMGDDMRRWQCTARFKLWREESERITSEMWFLRWKK